MTNGHGKTVQVHARGDLLVHIYDHGGVRFCQEDNITSRRSTISRTNAIFSQHFEEISISRDQHFEEITIAVGFRLEDFVRNHSEDILTTGNYR